MVKARGAAILSLAALTGCLTAVDGLPLPPCQNGGGCAAGFACSTVDFFCHPLADAGVDGGQPHDAGVDAGPDAGFDAGYDAGFDAGPDAGFDAGPDAGPVDAGCIAPGAAPGGITPRAWFALAVDGANLLMASGAGTCEPLTSLALFETTGGQGSESKNGTTETAVGLAGGFVPGSSPPPPSPQLFLFGGAVNGLSGNALAELDPYDDLSPSFGFQPLPLPLGWLASAPLPVQAPAPGGGSLTDVLFFLVGGQGASGDVSSTLLIFDPLGTTPPKQGHWYQPDAGLPTARSHLGAAIGPDGLLYAIGGQDDAGTPVAGVDAFNLAASCLNAIGVLDGGILGDGDGGNAPCGWTTPTALPTPRTDLAVTTGPDGLIYTIGGLTAAGTTGVVEAYNPADGGWITAPSLVLPRHGHGAATTSDGLIWVLGGVDADGGVSGSVEVYDPASDGGWQATP